MVNHFSRHVIAWLGAADNKYRIAFESLLLDSNISFIGYGMKNKDIRLERNSCIKKSTVNALFTSNIQDVIVEWTGTGYSSVKSPQKPKS